MGTPPCDLVALRRARDYYERAVALDSSFALAWAQLSRAHSNLYFCDISHDPGRRRRRAGRPSGRWRSRRAPRRLPGPGGLLRTCGTNPRRRSSSTPRGRQLAPKDARLLTWAA